MNHMFFDTKVQIGLNPNMAKDQRHGIVWVQMNGGIEKHGFLADKPQRLEEPTDEIVDDMFSQLMKMGLRPVNLEIMVNKVRRVYSYGKRAPMIVQSYM